MRRFIIIIVFLALAAVIIAPLAAEMQFNAARTLENQYRWKAALRRYEWAIKLDPFNSEYPTGLGRFLYQQSGYRKDRLAYFKRAESLYRRAIKLNPKNALYYVRLGKAQIEMAEVKKALETFKKAAENDPHGFANSYLMGYAGTAVWNTLTPEDKEWIIGRLKYALQVRPRYSNKIYSRLWSAARDGGVLQELRPGLSGQQMNEKKEKINEIKEVYRNKLKWMQMDGNVLSAKDWRGISSNGRLYKNGNMYWSGTVYAPINAPKGKAVIRVQAKGSAADGIWPHMIVELDAEEIGETFVESADWKEYSFKADTDGGLKALSVTFVNDGGNPRRKEDRNLYVGEARVEVY